MSTPTPSRVAITRAERDTLTAQGYALTTSGEHLPAAVFLHVPRDEAGTRLLLALACLRNPESATLLVSADRARRLADRRKHYSERERVTLSDIYDADARTTSPVIASLGERTLVPHPLDGVAYADGVHASRLPWRKVPT